MEIIAAWPHKNGKGFDVGPNVMPLDERLKLHEEMDEGAPKIGLEGEG